MNTWWEKQEGLERLAKVFKETQKEYIIENEERNTPKPPMSPFDYNQDKDDNLFFLPWVTCKDAIGDFDYPLKEDKDKIPGSKDKDLLKLVPPGDNYLFFTKKRNHPKPLFKWRSRYWSFLLKLSPSKPSWTIQASFSNNMGPFHWKNRFLRIQESSNCLIT